MYSCLYAAHQRNRAVLLLVVKEERTVLKPADKVIAPVMLDNPVLSHTVIIPKNSATVSISSDPSFPLRRWEIEVSFRDMKTTLGYEFIRGRTPHIVKLELGVLVLAYNLLRYVIARGQAPGKRRGIASTAAAAISFISTIPILYAARRSLVKAFAMLVAAVAADSLERRRRKNYARAVKRRPKPYPLLTKPRSEYRPEEII